MNRDSIYAFYGSLRQGLENYVAFGGGQLKYLYTTWIDGFRLYSLGEYPYAVRTNQVSDRICVELYEIEDPVIEQSIHQMELEAEYYYDEVAIDGRKFGIYLFSQARTGDKQVLSGDWKEYLEEGKV